MSTILTIRIPNESSMGHQPIESDLFTQNPLWIENSPTLDPTPLPGRAKGSKTSTVSYSQGLFAAALYEKNLKKSIEATARLINIFVQTGYTAIYAIDKLAITAEMINRAINYIPFASVKSCLLSISRSIQKAPIIDGIFLSNLGLIATALQTPLTLVDIRRSCTVMQTAHLSKSTKTAELIEKLTSLNDRFLRLPKEEVWNTNKKTRLRLEKIRLSKLETTIGTEFAKKAKKDVPRLLQQLPCNPNAALEASDLLSTIETQSSKHRIIHLISLAILALYVASSTTILSGTAIAAGINLPITAAIFALYVLQYTFDKTIASHKGWRPEFKRLIPHFLTKQKPKKPLSPLPV